jgi:hypothetical protein
MRTVLAHLAVLWFFLPGAPLSGWGASEASGGAGSVSSAENYEMITDDKESNRAFYRAIGFEFVPEEMVRDNDSVYHLDGKQARFLGLMYVAEHAIAPACYTLQPFTDDLATKRCNLMKRPMVRNDPATRTLVCGPRRVEDPPAQG